MRLAEEGLWPAETFSTRLITDTRHDGTIRLKVLAPINSLLDRAEKPMCRFAVALLALMALNQTLNGQDQLDRSTPRWLRDYKFEPAAFAFVRIKFDDNVSAPRRRGSWATDYPDADLALSKHLATVTSLEVDPKGKVLKLTDKSLSDYPFIYIGEPGRMRLSDSEVKALRRYLLGGGFLLIDDFWGEDEWKNFYREIKRAFPDREPMQIGLDHSIFHCVYDLNEKPQVPSINAYNAGRTTERKDANQANFMAIYDDNNRMMVLICHNTDLADGWAGISEGGEYAREVSIEKAIPMGTNVIFYALTQRLPRASR